MPPLPSPSRSSLYLWTPTPAQSSTKLSGSGHEKRSFPPHQLQMDESQNAQIGCNVPHISFTKVVHTISLPQLHWFVNPQLLLSNSLHALVLHAKECTHYPAGFVIFTQLTQLWILFVIILIVRTWKIVQTVCDSIHHFLQCLFRLSGCQSHFAADLISSCSFTIGSSASSTDYHATADYVSA
jgi:hypothetical protein